MYNIIEKKGGMRTIINNKNKEYKGGDVYRVCNFINKFLLSKLVIKGRN